MASRKKEEVKPGKVDINHIRDIINKKNGQTIAYNLKEDDNPTEVREWIPTGSTLLDYSIARGKKAGIPVSKITELASLSSVGKSYMAAGICANAQKMGISVVYFDSESA